MHQVALVQVIRPHTDPHQVLHQLALDVHIIVDTRQQYGLVAERDAGPGQLIAGFSQLLRDFVGMVYMDIHPQRMEFLKHLAQFVGNALGHEDRHARPDPHDLDVRDFPQTCQDLFQDLRRQHQRIAAREQHIPYLWGVLQVFDLHVELVA